MSTQSFVSNNYNLFRQRSDNWQVIVYVLLFIVIAIITFFALVGVSNGEYNAPLHPMLSFLIWAIVLALMFFSIFLLWDDLNISDFICGNNVSTRKFGKDIPYVFALLASLTLLLAGAIAYFYWQKHIITLIAVSLALVMLVLTNVQVYHINHGAGFSLLPLTISVLLVLLKVLLDHRK